MSIKCNLSTLMGANRYNIQDVADKTGLTRDTISKLYHDNMGRIDSKTLSKLCALFKCSVGDILIYIPDEDER